MTGWVRRCSLELVTRSRPASQGAIQRQGGGGQKRLGGSLAGVSRVKMATTTGTRGVVRGPITSAGVNMGSGLVIMHEFLEFLRKVGKKEQYSSPPTGPRRASGTPDGLIRNPPGPSRSAHTPWGHCDRLGCSGMTCTRRSQPSRRPRTPRRWCERWRSEAARWGSYG